MSPGEVNALLDQLADEILEKLPPFQTMFPYHWRIQDTSTGERLTKLKHPEARLAALAAAERIAEPPGRKGRMPEFLRDLWVYVLQTLLRRKLPFDDADLCRLFAAAEHLAQRYLWKTPYASFVKALESFTKENEPSSELRKAAARIRKHFDEMTQDKDVRKIRDRLDAAIGKTPDVPLNAGEAWSDAVHATVTALDTDRKNAWVQLLLHCATATAGKPSGKWRKEAKALVAELGGDATGAESFRARLVEWLPLVGAPRTQPIEQFSQYGPDPNLVFDERNADVLKGLLWCVADHGDAVLARLLADVAFSSYKKVRGLGPRCVKVGNACVWALGQIPGEAALAALAILKVRVKSGNAQKGIQKAMDAVAEREGVSRDDLEEMGVPGYGLQEVGLREETLGDFKAQIVVDGPKAELRWLKADGKRQKSVPKAVRDNHADELKEIRATVKDVEKMLAAQRERLDNLYLARKSWPMNVWRERYLDHPLVGSLARRLIWRFEDRSATWHDGALVDANGKALEGLDNATVHLWHPLDDEVDAVLAWRRWLEAHEVRQPFRQAHREIYRLTDAERQTNVYSNRFAAHILKQHQFNALCHVRGWRNQLRLMVDDEYEPASLELPQWDLRAEFWVEGAGDDYERDVTDSGTFIHLSTDQVRFYRLISAKNRVHAGGGGYRSQGGDREANHPLPLAEIDPLVFSEVMRDVDLFVGVSSVGNDPTWGDTGGDVRYRAYWSEYSFGDLGETAKTRKAVLENLVPRLKIRDRCRVEGRFLHVRGDIRSYKIHLGSANILMEPTDEYLCIVPSQNRGKKADSVFLPFEGDSRMSVILSKAFLLAEDTKIKDPTILSQVRPGS